MDPNERLREASGRVSDPRPLVAFLYELIRDEVQPGVVERITLASLGMESWQFTNGWIAMYAQDIADRLLCAPDDTKRCWYCKQGQKTAPSAVDISMPIHVVRTCYGGDLAVMCIDSHWFQAREIRAIGKPPVTDHQFTTSFDWRTLAGIHENDKDRFCMHQTAGLPLEGLASGAKVCMRPKAEHKGGF